MPFFDKVEVNGPENSEKDNGAEDRTEQEAHGVKQETAQNNDSG